MEAKRWIVRGALVTGVVLVAIQLVPYGRDHSNPPVTSEPAWDSPRTRELAQRACFDCHSNEVTWPWYSHIAPASWLVQRDVDRGRAVLNVSEWKRVQEEATESADAFLEGEMPLRPYLWMHPSARMNPAERDLLAGGLRATFGGKGEARGNE